LADLGVSPSEMRRQFFFTLISPVAAAVLAVTYSLWFRGSGYSAKASLGWGLAGIFCTPNWYYGTSTFDDMLGTVAIVIACAATYLGRQRWPLVGAAVAGLAMGWAVNCKQPYGLFVLPVLAGCCDLQRPWYRQLAPAALVLGGLAAGVVAYKLYDDYKFPPGTTEPYEAYAQLYGSLYTSNPVPGLASLLLSPSAGIFWYCPTLLLSVHGWLAWRRERPLFCYAVLASCLGFLGFLSFLTFFKGDPAWGPRYLTPAFGLCWVFVPAASLRVGWVLIKFVLILGVAVQLLALSVDPQRLLLEKALAFTYYDMNPWQNFEPQTASLVQRPREILVILRGGATRSPYFSPADYPTSATYLGQVFPMALISEMGVLANPDVGLPGLYSFYPMLLVAHVEQFERQSKEAVERYHVFSSLRPWCISQQYLSAQERPVAMGSTLALLAVMGAVGLALLALGLREQKKG
jgi:hypothetical protein